ncbi:VOC family protein [Ancylobacter oerskovii]|uniref:VOC family protein n=1 Tax=Ancylobacter oerskovii TaxID=459519 RepID=A0ABW4YVD8_9HYPH|nr:VOC family protein [Ancylobacter oerskovii]MBS7544517.1 VOC family protein [Ancylobacter oerskovii]
MAETPQHGAIVWNELNSHDVEAAKSFYGRLMGWDFVPMPVGDRTYWVIKKNGVDVGGMFAMNGPEFDSVPPHWMTYVAVDDVDASVKQAKAAGGRALKAPFDIPGVGRIAVVKDAEGAVMGWITPKM